MNESVKVPLQGNQQKHLLALKQNAAAAQRDFEGAVVAIAAAAAHDGAATVTAVLDGPEPHVLLTPPEAPKKG